MWFFTTYHLRSYDKNYTKGCGWILIVKKKKKNSFKYIVKLKSKAALKSLEYMNSKMM